MLSAADRQAWERLGARFLALRAASSRGVKSSDIIDLDGTLLAWMRGFKARGIALRPDRFVAAADVSGLGVPE